jgi:hypothetical protein
MPLRRKEYTNVFEISCPHGRFVEKHARNDWLKADGIQVQSEANKLALGSVHVQLVFHQS